ncbi:MAG: DUF2914 domain-containing protein [Deltaproteobacteria bacterium]|nr:DUF2914 domain-containing protein [Deltaproteobacteria bacterium]
MTSPGRILKNARESQGISLKEVADSTKILQRYLEGLEEENYSYLPSEVYIKGYFQSYARYLKIDPEEILRKTPKNSLLSEQQSTPPPIETKQSTKINKELRRKATHFIVIGSSIAALGICLIVWIGALGGSAKLAGLLSSLTASFIQVTPNESPRKKHTVHSLQEQPDAGARSDVAKESSSATPSQDSTPSSRFISRASSVPQKTDDLRGDTVALESFTGEIVRERITTLPPPPEAAFERVDVNDPTSPASIQSESGAPAILRQLPILPDPITKPLIRPASTVSEPQGIIIDTYSICTGVKNRTPQNEKSVFSTSDGRVYTWMLVKNATPPTVLRHIYYFQGKKTGDIALDIRYPSMRTWSYKTINNPLCVGEWRVDVATEAGKVLKSIKFQVVP